MKRDVLCGTGAMMPVIVEKCFGLTIDGLDGITESIVLQIMGVIDSYGTYGLIVFSY